MALRSIRGTRARGLLRLPVHLKETDSPRASSLYPPLRFTSRRIEVLSSLLASLRVLKPLLRQHRHLRQHHHGNVEEKPQFVVGVFQ